MSLYDILTLSCITISFIILILYYTNTEEFDRNGFIINTLFIIKLCLMSLIVSSLFLLIKYEKVEIPESSNIKGYIFENLNSEDNYLANSVKEETFECINHNLIKFLTKNDSTNLVNTVKAKNSTTVIHKEQYEYIYKDCLVDYLTKSTTKKEYNEKLEIFKKTKIL